MPLTFANRSRSYDENRRQIRFVGHDGIFEIPFVLEVDALPKGSAQSGPTEAERTEADCLAAFDAARESVLSVARKAYAHARQRIYVLTPTDFR